jgi:hypothetical protein
VTIHPKRVEIQRLRDAAASLPELVRLFDRLEHEGATLCCAEPPLDTATAGGRAAVALLREIAGWTPVRPPGRPGLRRADPALVDQIEALRRAGLSLQAIADRLNADRTPTPRGGAVWRPSSVQSALGYRRPRPPHPPPPPRPR